MAALSDCVSRAEGVLVDYIGDELLAMWGAPFKCPNHAELACRAALDMHSQLAVLNARWRDRIDAETDVGIGVNSGPAFVGNTGSHRKFKYGPLGNAVNLASRVQGATKQVKATAVITNYTRSAIDPAVLSGDLRTRRLCRVRVVNIKEPVDLFELVLNPDEDWTSLQTRYERALDDFDASNFGAATRQLGNLLSDYPNDGPTLRLLSRSVNALANGPDGDHPLWEFGSK